MIEEYLKDVDVLVKPLSKKGSYIAEIKGHSPTGEPLDFTIELLGCTSDNLLKDTLTSKLEEILACKYGYEYDDFDEEDLQYDGGTFR